MRGIISNPKMIQWFVFTALVGLIPIFIKILLWAISDDYNISIALALASYCLLLNISMFNKLAHYDDPNKMLKTAFNGVTILLIIFSSILFAIYEIGSNGSTQFNLEVIEWILVVMSILSFLLCAIVQHRVPNE